MISTLKNVSTLQAPVADASAMARPLGCIGWVWRWSVAVACAAESDAVRVLNGNIRVKALATAMLLVVPGLALAENAASSVTPLVQEAIKTVEFSGFISVRGGQIFEDDVFYAFKYDDSITFSQESVFGLQMNSTVTNNVDVSMQITAAGGDNPVEMQWAYIEYAFDTDLSARFGRLRVPGFMLSEFLDVGYAYPWAQTPEEVYGWLPFSRYEGLDLRYQMHVAGTDLRFNPFAGTTSGQALSLGDFEFTDQTSEFAGVDIQGTYDILTVRAGYSRYKFELTNSRWDQFIGQTVNGKTYVPEIGNELFTFVEEVKLPGFVDFVEDILVDGILQQMIDNPAIATFLGVNASTDELIAEQQSLLAQLPAFQQIPAMDGSEDGSFAGVGFSLDNGSYLVMSEVSRSKIGGAYPDVESGYMLLGYRFGTWMPHFTFAKMYSIDDDERPKLGTLDLNADIWLANEDLAQVQEGAGVYSDILALANSLLQLEQETYTLGLRWDPLAGVAVKAEVFRVRPSEGNFGFALPSSLVLLMSSTDVALESLTIPETPKKIDGLRMSIDAVF